MSMDTKAILHRLYDEVWNQRKLDVVDQLIAPSHALDFPTLSDSLMGPEAYKREITRFITAFPDLRFTVEDVISEKDKVVVSWVISGTHRGEFLGISPTQRKIAVKGITIHQIADGKILDSYASWDALGLLQQVGVVPVPAPAQSKGTASAR